MTAKKKEKLLKSTIEEINRQIPFKNILKIVDLKSLKSNFAWSGESFKVKSADGKVYKLRCFSNFVIKYLFCEITKY